MLRTEDQFLELIRANSKPRKTGRLSLSTDHLLRQTSECWNGTITKPPLFFYHGNAIITDVTEGRDILNDESLAQNWVWDRTTQTFIFNISSGRHESLLGNLYILYSGNGDTIGNHDNAGAYIREGFGFSLSSVGNHPHKGADVKLTAQERQIFKGIKFVDVE
jgi:hypothetical protein